MSPDPKANRLANNIGRIRDRSPLNGQSRTIRLNRFAFFKTESIDGLPGFVTNLHPNLTARSVCIYQDGSLMDGKRARQQICPFFARLQRQKAIGTLRSSTNGSCARFLLEIPDLEFFHTSPVSGRNNGAQPQKNQPG
jgi:hypothetical protein